MPLCFFPDLNARVKVTYRRVFFNLWAFEMKRIMPDAWVSGAYARVRANLSKNMKYFRYGGKPACHPKKPDVFRLPYPHKQPSGSRNLWHHSDQCSSV